jgi:quercetin dioxygenase-like cupin family protein
MEAKMHCSDNEAGQDALAASVFDLAGLVDYLQGSVVSRTIIDKKAGTVTLFAFDEGEGLSEHVAPLDGEVEILISAKPFRVKQGQMILMPADQPHALRAVTRFKMLLVMIRS